MSRILKALLKTIIALLGTVLFVILANMFPYILIALMLIGLIVFLFINFYINGED